MAMPQYHSKVKKLLGDDFSDLLSEISPFIGPRLDVYITNDKFFVSAEIAGIESDDCSVKLLGNILVIEGTIKQKYAKKKRIS